MAQRFPVVMIDLAGKLGHLAGNRYAMTMTFVVICGEFPAIQNSARRVDRAAQGPAENAISELGRITRDILWGIKRADFVHQFRC